jgi:hypothetical protein
MGQQKREAAEAEERYEAIQAIGLEKNALIEEEEGEEPTTNMDDEATMEAVASVFRSWADGKIKGSFDEIVESTKQALEID